MKRITAQTEVSSQLFSWKAQQLGNPLLLTGNAGLKFRNLFLLRGLHKKSVVWSTLKRASNLTP